MDSTTSPLRLETVLVYLDTRLERPPGQVPACLSRVARLVNEAGGRLILCDVVTEPGEPGARSELHERLLALRRGYAQDTLERLLASCPSPLAAEVVVCAGKPLPELIRLSLERKVDVTVCIPVTAPGGILDSVTLHLLRKSPSAVWIMRDMPARATQRIGVAVDREIFAGSEHPRLMAEQLLNAAITFARAGATEIHLVHAWQMYGAEILAVADTHLDAEEVRRYHDSQRYAHTVWLQEMHDHLRRELAARGSASIHSETHLLEGAPGAALPAWAASLGMDVLMLGTVGSSFIPGLLIGTNAETIVSAIDVPILALKPPGFRSPLVPAAQLP